MTIEKVNQAIQRLKAFEPEEDPYYLCYSGGKDSDCIRILASLANVKHDIVHSHTTVDAPETVDYVRSIPGVKIDYSFYSDGTPKTMWNLIVKKKMPPTRIVRYCCEHLKEHGGKGRLKITGVRSAESVSRAKNGGLVNIIGKPKTVRKRAAEMLDSSMYQISDKDSLILNFDNSDSRHFVEHCYRTTSLMVNPIIDWSNDDVWEFLHHYGCRSNPLYDCGFSRVGCVGCPMASNRMRQFDLYPKFKNMYIRAFDRMLKTNTDTSYSWNSGYEVFQWWMEIPVGQMSFFDAED